MILIPNLKKHTCDPEQIYWKCPYSIKFCSINWNGDAFQKCSLHRYWQNVITMLWMGLLFAEKLTFPSLKYIFMKGNKKLFTNAIFFQSRNTRELRRMKSDKYLHFTFSFAYMDLPCLSRSLSVVEAWPVDKCTFNL